MGGGTELGQKLEIGPQAHAAILLPKLIISCCCGDRVDGRHQVAGMCVEHEAHDPCGLGNEQGWGNVSLVR